MTDRLDEVIFYKLSCELWDEFWDDSEILLSDVRGREIAKQLTRSVGSISANIEEGYGRGFGKEYPQFLRIARGLARESKGWYSKSKRLLKAELIANRIAKLDSIIAMLVKSIQTIEEKNRSSSNKGTKDEGRVTRENSATNVPHPSSSVSRPSSPSSEASSPVSRPSSSVPRPSN